MKFWASSGKVLCGPAETREAAADALFAQKPKLREATTGYGEHGPHFDIRWIRRPVVVAAPQGK